MKLVNLPPPMPEGKEDWVYKDWPNMLEPLWRELFGIIGEGNFELLTEARRRWPDGTVTFRGQMLIAPTGVANMKARAALAKETNNG
jgi:hypothetical protein